MRMYQTAFLFGLMGLFGALPAQSPEKQSQARVRWEQMDKNGDGKISREEWTGKPKVFDRLDANHDGFLTKDEIRARRAKRNK